MLPVGETGSGRLHKAFWVSAVASRWVGLFPWLSVGHVGFGTWPWETTYEGITGTRRAGDGHRCRQRIAARIDRRGYAEGIWHDDVGTMTRDLDALAAWLSAEGVHSVAVEATGVYWLCLYEALEAAGIEVLVVIAMGASHVQHMQKALERMNIKFHAVISDLTGASGLRVMRAILDGERDPQQLLALCDAQIQKKKAERVRESLRGTWKAEHLFALRQALSGWEFYQSLIRDCDRAIEQVLHELGGPPQALPPVGQGKPGAGNSPQIEGLHRMLVHLCGGTDATQLPGMADYSLLQVIGEVGTDLRKWPTEKHFTAWAGLAPAARQSGKRRSRASRHTNRTGQLFCTMARSLANSVDKGLGGFYRRLKARRGGLVANKALARKLAALFWQVMVHGVAYVEQGLKKYEERVATTEQRVLRKLAMKHGLQLVPHAPRLSEVPG